MSIKLKDKTGINSDLLDGKDSTQFASTSIATTSVNGLMSTAMVSKLNGIDANANLYVHPTSAGYKHIPSGGSTGQILQWSKSGTAIWADPSGGVASGLLDGGASGSLIGTNADQNAVLGDNSLSLGMMSKATGNNAMALGYAVTASEEAAFAEGNFTVASGRDSHAEGNGTTASGDSSHAEGVSTQATKYCAHAEGFSSKAIGMRSHAEGQSTTASGANAHAEGQSTIASGENSHAEGFESQALGRGAHAEGLSYNGYISKAYVGSHAEGIGCEAGKDNSLSDPTQYGGGHAEGIYTKATGRSAHAEGYKSVASGTMSHAEGYTCTASGSYCHAEGYNTTASNTTSHTQGHYTKASGYYSHAEGYYTTAETYAVHVQGRYNKVNSYGSASSYITNSNAFVIGNGSSSSALSNAFRVMYSGATYALSAFNSSGADYAEYFEWLDGNPNNEDRIGHFVALDGDKIKLANSEDDYIIGIISGNQSIIGNACEDSWNDMYIRDEFERLQYEEVKVDREEIIFNEETNEHETKTIKVIENHIKLNPNYDSSVEYIPRSERKEWAVVGMLGQIIVKDDGTCKVNGYCKPSDNGIATYTDDKSWYRVMKRINDHLIKVIVK